MRILPYIAGAALAITIVAFFASLKEADNRLAMEARVNQESFVATPRR